MTEKHDQLDIWAIKDVMPIKTISMPLMIGIQNGGPVFDDKLISILTPIEEK